MKVLPLFLVALCVCSALFFYAPHHRRDEIGFKPATLGQFFYEFFRELPEIISRSALWFAMLGIAGIVSSFYPAILILMTRWASPAAGQPGGDLFILGGLIAAIGTVVNFIAILISHVSFGFGGAISTGEKTAFWWILPLFQLIFAAVSFAIGCSATCFSWLSRLLRL